MRFIGRALLILGVLDLVISALLCALLVMPNLLGISLYTVMTGSMEPAIPVGSLVFVEPADPADLAGGDVVTYRGRLSEQDVSTSVITHRVVANDPQSKELETKGDANNGMDILPVPYGEVIGKVVFSVPLLGTVGTSLSTWLGKMSLITLIIGGLLLSLVGDQLVRVSKRRASNALEKTAF